MAQATHSEKIPASMRDIYEQIVGLTDAFSVKYHTEEYAQLVRYATAALCRKRPSPLFKGKAKTWACGITHAIGFVNFFFDRSQEPSMSATDLYAAFGVGKSTGGAKSKLVRDLLNMYQLDPNWCLPSKLDNNPRAWMITVNGFILDARSSPRNMQEAAYAKGLIPYVPE